MSRTGIVLTITLFCCISIVNAAIVVDPNGSHDYTTIQTAINSANNGDIIVVNPATYTENINLLGKAITVRSADPNDPAVVQSTVIDGDQAGTVITFNSGEDANTIVAGLSITNGFESFGAGIYCDSSSPTVDNCQFSNNSASSGGAVYSYASCPVLKNCTFVDNSASLDGGAIYGSGAEMTLVNCIFKRNHSQYGGAVYLAWLMQSQLVNCLFVGNQATEGGGLYSDGHDTTLVNCTFSSNYAQDYGGAVYNSLASLYAYNCIFWGNTPVGDTEELAQVYSDSPAPPAITYCCIQDSNSSDVLIPFGGTANHNIDDDPLFIRDPYDGEDGWNPGDTDDFGNLRLFLASPCIDAADNTALPPDSADIDSDANTTEPLPWDLDHNHRCFDDPCVTDTGNGTPPLADMGAYEARYIPSVQNITQATTHPSIQEAIDLANPADEIVLSPAVYSGAGNTDISFNGQAVTVRSIDPTDPDLVAATIIDCQNSAGGFYFTAGEDSNSIIDGLTITNASCDTAVCDNSSPIIRNCVLRDNEAFAGGAIYCLNSAALIENCTIRNNTGYYGGGGICAISDSPTSPAPAIRNCAILYNSVASGSDPGGGILAGCSATMENCLIAGNTAVVGGGIYGTTGPITNCTIVGNSTGCGGFGGYLSGPGLRSCTGFISNCIIWANFNSWTLVAPQLFDCSAPAYSCIQDWPSGGLANIASDPLFADAASGDYHLKSQAGRWHPLTKNWVADPVTSPCIDAGNPGSLLGDEPAHPNNVRVNMGAYGATAEASKTPPGSYLLADLTNDHVVNLEDLDVQTDDWLSTEADRPGDLNRDRLVNHIDMAILANAWLE